MKIAARHNVFILITINDMVFCACQSGVVCCIVTYVVIAFIVIGSIIYYCPTVHGCIERKYTLLSLNTTAVMMMLTSILDI